MCQLKELDFDLLFHHYYSAFLLAQKPPACSSNCVSQDGSLAIFSCNLNHKILHHS